MGVVAVVEVCASGCGGQYPARPHAVSSTTKPINLMVCGSRRSTAAYVVVVVVIVRMWWWWWWWWPLQEKKRGRRCDWLGRRNAVCALVFFSYQGLSLLRDGLGLPRDPSPILSPKTTVSYHHHIIIVSNPICKTSGNDTATISTYVCVCVCVCPRRPMHLHVQVQMGSLWKYESLPLALVPPATPDAYLRKQPDGGKRGQDGRQWTRGLNGMFPQRLVSPVETRLYV